jgi:hypothetical protein
VTVSASPSSQSDGDVLRLGRTYRGDGFSATVYRYKKNGALSAPKAGAGERWDAIDVKVCVTDKSTLSWVPWDLVGTDDGLYGGSDLEYNQFPQPAYPDGDQPVAGGQCVRGWIVFPVKTSAVIKQVQYSLNDGNDVTVVHWTVS